MYARSSTFRARPESIDTGVAYVRDEVMPELLGTQGCIGMSMLVDRESGRCVATSAWQSQQAMRASEEQMRTVRERAGEVLGGAPEVEEWEIAVLHRDHASQQGACVRATWVRVDPDRIDRAVDVYKMVTLPALEELDGFCSASLLVDRMSGRAVSSVTYDGPDALARTREQAAAVRAAGIKEAGGEVMDVCEFELALAHLHVPEMA